MKLFRWPGRRKHSAERITAYVDGELSSDERAHFEADLEHSPALRHAVEAERVLKLMLKSGLPEVPAPRSFALTEEMVRRAQPAPTRTWFPAGAARVAQATAAVAAIGFVTFTMIDISGGASGNDRDASRSSPVSFEAQSAGVTAEDAKAGEQPQVTDGQPPAFTSTPSAQSLGEAHGDDDGVRTAADDHASATPPGLQQPESGFEPLHVAQLAALALAILALAVHFAAQRTRSPASHSPDPDPLGNDK